MSQIGLEQNIKYLLLETIRGYDVAYIKPIETRIDNIVATSGTEIAELVDARGGYTVLKNRLDAMEIAGKSVTASINKSSYEVINNTIYAPMTDIRLEGHTTQSSDLFTITSSGIPLEDGRYKYILKSQGQNFYDEAYYRDIRNYNLKDSESYKPALKPLKLLPNTTYYARTTVKGTNIMECGISLKLNDGRYFYILGAGGAPGKLSFTTDSTGLVQVAFYVPNNNFTQTELDKLYDNFTFMISNHVTKVDTHEPYKESIAEVILPFQLCGIDNSDVLYYDSAEKAWCVDQYTQDVVLDGSQQPTMVQVMTNAETYVYAQFYNFDDIIKDNATTVSAFAKGYQAIPQFNGTSPSSLFNGTSSYVCTTYTSHKLRFALLKSLIGDTVTATIVKEYFKNNPVTVKITRQTPIKHILPKDVQVLLNSVDGTTTVQVESGGVLALLSATINKSTQSTVNTLVQNAEVLDARLNNVERLASGTNINHTGNNVSFINAEKTIKGKIQDIKVDGQTLLNLSGMNKLSLSFGNAGKIVPLTNMIKPNTTYTQIVRVKVNSLAPTDSANNVAVLNETGDTTNIFTPRLISNSFKGLIVNVATTPVDLSTVTNISRVRTYAVTTSGRIDFEEIILEGDWSNKELPQFIEGLTSVGESAESLSLESIKGDENLFDKSILAKYVTSKTAEGSTVDYTKVFTDNVNLLPNPTPNTQYTISFNAKETVGSKGVRVRVWYTDNAVTDLTIISTTMASITTTSTAGKSINRIEITYGYYGGNCVIDLDSFTICKGTSITSTKFSNSKKNILAYDPIADTHFKPVLRESYQATDTLEVHEDGCLYYHQRNNIVTYTNTSSIVKASASGTKIDRYYDNAQALDGVLVTNLPLVCNKFSPNSQTWNVAEINTVSTGSSTVFQIGFNLEYGKYTLEQAKELIKGAVVIYPLATERVYKCTEWKIDVFDNETLFKINAGAMQPKSFSVATQSHIGNIVRDLQDEAKENTNFRLKMTEALTRRDESSNGELLFKDSRQGLINDIVLEGKTLNNIFDDSRVVARAGWTYDSANNIHTGTASSGYKNFFTSKELYTANTKYTLIFDVLQNSLNDRYIVNDGGTDGVFGTTGLIIPTTKTGKFTFKLTTRADISTCLYGLRSFIPPENTTGTIQLKITILEGWIDDKYLPTNFRRLGSVGENAEILVNSRKENGNLFTDTHMNSYESSYTYDGKDLTVTGKWYVRFKLNHFSPNTDYTISTTKYGTNASRGRINIYYNDGTFVSATLDAPCMFNTKTGVESIAFYCSDGTANTVTFKDLIINKGIQSIPYEPQRMSAKQILHFNDVTKRWRTPVLRATQVLKDSIEQHTDGLTYYHKRNGEALFTGASAETWFQVSVKTDTIGFGINVTPKGSTNIGRIISNIFSNMGSDDIEQIRLGNDGSSIFVFINKTRLTNQSVAGFKAWLQTNNLKAIYELLQEEIYECTPLTLSAFNGDTFIFAETGAISPILKARLSNSFMESMDVINNRLDIIEDKLVDVLQHISSNEATTDIPLVSNVLQMTTDWYQVTTLANNTEIRLPQTTSYQELHLFFKTTGDLTIVFPSGVKWNKPPEVLANKSYELVFTYTDHWMAGLISYE